MDNRERIALRLLREAMDTEPAQRPAFVRLHCAGDAALEARVMALLGDADAIDTEDAAGAHVLPDDPADPLVGQALGAFRVIERVGRGGMGVVYRGERAGADFHQEVALKLIRRGFDFDDIRARFLRERRILARLDHPHLAHFIDGGVAPDGRPWFALEFVRGEPISLWCDARRLALRARVRLFLDVCAAVQHAHGQLVVHRDLKPGNILVDGDGHVHLLDFGIARLLADDDEASATTMFGSRSAYTPEYAAPEQLGGAPAGVATDVYALGVVLYELITGGLPYELDRRDPAMAERRIREQPPQSPAQAITRGGADVAAARLKARHRSLRAFRREVRGDLSRILGKALAKEPAHRYASVQAFADDLARWCAGEPVQVSGNALAYRVRKFVGRNRVAVGFASLALLATVIGVGATFWQMRETRLQRDAAVAAARRAEAVSEYVMLLFGSVRKQEGGQLNASEVMRQAAARAVDNLKESGEQGLRTALALAQLYSSMDDAEKSVAILDRMLVSDVLRRFPPIEADVRYLKADGEFSRGNKAEARKQLDLAQTFWLRDAARYQIELSGSRLIQGRIERGESDFQKSADTFARGIAERTQALGTVDSDVGLMYIGRSLSLDRLGRVDDALRDANAAVETFDKLGELHATYGLNALSTRGGFRAKAGDGDGAMQDLQLVVGLRQRLFGPSNELASANGVLASLMIDQKRPEEAVAILETALPMAEEFSGENSRTAGSLRRRLAVAYRLAGRADDSLRVATELHASEEALHGTGSLEAGEALMLRGQALHALGRHPESDEALKVAQQTFEAVGKAGEVRLGELNNWRARVGNQ